MPRNGVEGISSVSSGLTGKLFGNGNKAWGASSSETSHSSSDALKIPNVTENYLLQYQNHLGNCFSLNRLINDKATLSAERISEAPSGAPLGFLKTSASEYNDAIDIDNPWVSVKLEASSISKSSTSSVLTLSEILSGDVEYGLALASVVAKNFNYWVLL